MLFRSLISDKKLSKRAEKPRFSHVGRRREVLGGVAPQGCFNHLLVVFCSRVAELLDFCLCRGGARDPDSTSLVSLWNALLFIGLW